MKTRDELDSKFKWDFTHIFSSDEEWEKTLNECVAEAERLTAYKGRLGEGFSAFKEALDASFALFQKFELAAIYASLKRSADGGDPKAQEFSAKVGFAGVKLSSALSFIEPEVLTIPEEVLRGYLKNEGMEKYAFYIEDMLRGKEHTLDAEKEELLAKLGNVSSAPHGIYTTFTDVDMTFPKVKDSNGEEFELTSGNYGVYRESRDRTLRESAFETFLGEYRRYINTLAETYSNSVKFDCFWADVRRYPSSLDAALFSGNIPTAVYTGLIEAVHESLPSMKKYLELRQKTLGLEKLDMFDLYVPMLESSDSKVSYDEAKKLVKEALAPLGEDYAALLDRAFSENWIDVYENKGKTSGAFSCGVFGVHPYVLLNYTDTLGDAFTLAHELGHAMHSYYSDKTQDYVNHGYKITVAEVASTVNEVLLTLHLMKKEKDEKKLAFILNDFLESFRTTVYRQTLFAEFELKTHEMCEKGIPLTPKVLNETYRSLLETYYNGAEVNDVMEVEWAYIPHFYRRFYVYQYATGFCSAVAIAKRIIETGDASGYLKFLTLGGSDYPLEELRVAGIDLSDVNTVKNALSLFDSTIEDLKKLLEK